MNKFLSRNIIRSVWFLCILHNITVSLEMLDIENDDDSFEQPQIWSNILEEWAISPPNVRDGRVMKMGQRYIPTSNVYITKRIGNVSPLGSQGYKPNYNPNGNNYNRITQNVAPSEVSETDLYLLGAIEKLVYRVDYMEKRLRKTEQLVYYLMAGNNQNKKEIIADKPCPMNFTRVGDNCYMFVINQAVNWKTANNICKSYNAQLTELESLNENNDIAAYLLNHYNGYNNFWLGGLNPGLLWIWSSSARPVNPNVNITNIQNANTSANSTINASTTIMKINNIGTNATTTQPTKPTGNKINNNNKPSNDVEIEGNGRCLGLMYKTENHIYKLHGFDCTSRQNFLCELPQVHINNEISRIAKQLFS